MPKKKYRLISHRNKKTGGEPYQEMTLTPAEELIIQATGVEGLSTVKTYGTSKASNTCELDELMNECIEPILEDEDVDIVIDVCVEKIRPRSVSKKEKCTKLSVVSSLVQTTERYQSEILLKADRVLTLLTSHVKNMEEYKYEQNLKLDRLLLIKEISLNIKEEEHRNNMAVKQVDLQIKTLELDVLKLKRP